MKKFILGFTILVLFGCNQTKTTKDNQSQNIASNNSDKNNSINNELPANNFFDSDENDSIRAEFPARNYFIIDKINFSRYIKNGQFEMDFDLLNNTDYKFSSVNFRAEIFSKMKNSDIICRSTVQFDDWKPKSTINYVPHHILNWEPNVIKHVYFTCYPLCNSSYERTPEEITLVIKIAKAISIDKEVEGAFVKYDLLDLWKERQVKEGLR